MRASRAKKAAVETARAFLPRVIWFFWIGCPVTAAFFCVSAAKAPASRTSFTESIHTCNEGKAAISPPKQRKTIDRAVSRLQNCRINCIISCIARICVFPGNILAIFFDETFAMLDKSVYHIFGEDCARCAKNSRFSAKSPRALGLYLSLPASIGMHRRAIVPSLTRILQFFSPNPSIMQNPAGSRQGWFSARSHAQTSPPSSGFRTESSC